MRFYHLLNMQHVMLFIFPALIGVILLGTALGYTHFKTKNTENRKKDIVYHYPDTIKDKNAPFPVFLTLVIVVTLIWMVCYILFMGFLEVQI